MPDEKSKCFVLMPFGSPHDKHFDRIYSLAIKEADLEPLRADSLFRPSPIMGDIWAFVRKSKVLLADLTGRNANVFYELGLAHAIGKPVVLVAETMEDVPFDLRGLRVITYDRNDPDWGYHLRNSIIASLKETLDDVLGAIPSMFLQSAVPADPAPKEGPLALQVRALAEEITALRRESKIKIPDRQTIRPGEIRMRSIAVTFEQTPSQSVLEAAAEKIGRRTRSSVRPTGFGPSGQGYIVAFRLENPFLVDVNEIEGLKREFRDDLNAKDVDLLPETVAG